MKYTNDILGFCHRHPKMEDDFSLLPDHVIIDREDWEQIRGLTEKPESAWTRHQRLLRNPKYLKVWLYFIEYNGLPRTEDKANIVMDECEKAMNNKQ